MVIEKSFKKATLTHQIGHGNSNLSLEIVPHPTISGCCMLTVLKFRDEASIEGADSNSVISQIVINRSELKTVANML